MARPGIETFGYALVVVRQGRRFLLIQERKYDQEWYLPAGRAEQGERLVDAALRETKEEAGLDVVLEGLIRVEHVPMDDGTARLRVIFVARPKDDAPPKSKADEHSLKAGWFTLDEVEKLPLRGDEVIDLFRYLERGGAVYPLKVLAHRYDVLD
jgi:phosphatase NudJ